MQMNQLVSKSSWKILFISQLLNLFFQVTTAACKFKFSIPSLFLREMITQ